MLVSALDDSYVQSPPFIGTATYQSLVSCAQLSVRDGISSPSTGLVAATERAFQDLCIVYALNTTRVPLYAGSYDM